MIEPGKILQNRYLIREQIGQGGMGAVYVATDERFNSTVAIKETLLMDDNYRKAIEREARLLNSLKHSALPRVTDHFLEDNGQFLVMEYIPGDDLYCILEREQKPFPIDMVISWADQLLDALDFLHNQENPVIHRDIKPQNLKLNARGQIVLLDFGLAKGNPTDADHQTAAKSIFGYSRNYASLEQIQGTGTDPRSDLYSLAATLYHLATGVPPVDALTRAMTVLGQSADPLLPANMIEPSIPAGVAGILHSAMDLNAARRPASAADMRKMLHEADQYEHLAEFPLQPVTVVQTDVLTQKTKLMPAATQQGNLKQTDVRTEVLPSGDSELTAVRPGAATAATALYGSGNRTFGERKRFGALPIAFALVVLAGIAGAGAYFYAPEMLDSKTVDAVPAPELIQEPPTAAQAVAGEAVTPVEATPAIESAANTSPPWKPAETAPPPQAKATAKKKLGEPGPSDIRVVGDTVYMGNVKITDGQIVTPGMYIDENGIRHRVPSTTVRPMPPMPPNVQYLTPEQQKKLDLLRQKAIEKALKPTPQQ